MKAGQPERGEDATTGEDNGVHGVKTRDSATEGRRLDNTTHNDKGGNGATQREDDGNVKKREDRRKGKCRQQLTPWWGG